MTGRRRANPVDRLHALGGVDRVRPLYCEQRGWSWLDALSQDVRFGIRVLLSDRGFALTAILVLGLGIGVNNMMFTIIYAHTMRGLPIPDARRVLYISATEERVADRGLTRAEVDRLQFAASFSGIGAFTNAPVALGDPGRVPERVDGSYVSGSAMRVAGLRPTLGRAISEDDDRDGAPLAVVVGARTWRSRYGADAALLGRTVLINGTAATVIGVAPDRSGFPSAAQVWLPLAHAGDGGASGLRVFGRLRDGVHRSDAHAEADGLIARAGVIGRDDPRPIVRAHLVPIDERFFGRPTDPAWIAFIAVGFLVLLVSCANAANLLLARAARRTREVAIRSSLGATRWRIVRQFLVESVALALAGGAIGLGIARAGVVVFRSAMPENALPPWLHYSVDARVFAALAGVSLATVLLFGLLPAVSVALTDVTRALKDGGRSVVRGARRHLATAFLAAELGVAVVLLAHVIVSLQNDGGRLPSDEVLDTIDVVTASLTLAGDRYRAPEPRAAFLSSLRDRLHGHAGAPALSFASALPLRGGGEMALALEGREPPAGETRPTVATVIIGPGYFRTLALPLTHGREFTDADSQPGVAHAIVNERFASRHLSAANPLGTRLGLAVVDAAAPTRWVTVVGIAPDVRQRPGAAAVPVVYLPGQPAPVTTSVILRSGLDPAAAATVLREAVFALDPQLPLYRVQTLKESLAEAQWNGRLSGQLITTLSLIALSLSLVGLYAVTAHAVGQRTPEIGLRMALGARPAAVWRLVIARAGTQVAIGFAIGVAVTLLWDASFHSGTTLRLATPGVLAQVGALIAVATLLACLGPARRATRLDPVAALKGE